MKSIPIVAVLALGTLTLTPCAARSEPPARRANAFDAAVDRAARAFMANGQTLALSIGIVKDGKTSTYNYGTTERGTQNPPTARTLYAIGSVTKTFTGILLAQAVVEKRLSLDDDVRKYLGGEYPNLEYEDHPVRLAHLIAHSSGLPHNLPTRADSQSDHAGVLAHLCGTA